MKWNYALSHVITARSVLPLKALNTWLSWCISQLAAGNPQSCMSSEVNGILSCSLSAYWKMAALGCNVPGHRTSEIKSHWSPCMTFAPPQCSFPFPPFDAATLLLEDIKLVMSFFLLSKYWMKEYFVLTLIVIRYFFYLVTFISCQLMLNINYLMSAPEFFSSK